MSVASDGLWHALRPDAIPATDDAPTHLDGKRRSRAALPGGPHTAPFAIADLHEELRLRVTTGPLPDIQPRLEGERSPKEAPRVGGEVLALRPTRVPQRCEGDLGAQRQRPARVVRVTAAE